MVLNDPDGFAETAESIISQGFSDFEWVVVDGASRDATRVVIENYRSFISAYVSEPDDGIYDAMLKGARLSSGEWTVFMNAGDTFAHKNVLENVARAPDADMYYGLAYWTPHPSRGIKTKRPIMFPNRPLCDIWKGTPFSHQAFFCRTSLIEKLKFRRDLKIAADYDFYVRALHSGASIHPLNFVVARIEDGGLSAVSFYSRTIERYRVVKDYYKDVNVTAYYARLIFDQARKDLGKKFRALRRGRARRSGAPG